MKIQGWKIVLTYWAKIFLLVITTQLLIRSISVEINLTARARKDSREKMLNEVSNALVSIFDHDISRDCKKSSTSKKSLTGDTDNTRQFYASRILKRSFSRSLIVILMRFVTLYSCQFKLSISHSIAVSVLINTYIAVHISFKKSFLFCMPQSSSFTFNNSWPLGWVSETLLMLETQYSQMNGRVTLSWFEHVNRAEK